MEIRETQDSERILYVETRSHEENELLLKALLALSHVEVKQVGEAWQYTITPKTSEEKK
jgi:hypothetical protein